MLIAIVSCFCSSSTLAATIPPSEKIPRSSRKVSLMDNRGSDKRSSGVGGLLKLSRVASFNKSRGEDDPESERRRPGCVVPVSSFASEAATEPASNNMEDDSMVVRHRSGCSHDTIFLESFTRSPIDPLDLKSSSCLVGYPKHTDKSFRFQVSCQGDNARDELAQNSDESGNEEGTDITLCTNRTCCSTRQHSDRIV